MKKVLWTLMLAAGVYACKHEPVAITPQPPVSGGGPGSGVCFEAEVLPLFQSNCAKSGCHDAASAQKGYVLDSYNNIVKKGLVRGNATNSKLYEVLFETGNDKMPPPPNPDLTSAQKTLIGKWINEGAKNTVSCASSCDTAQFKYGADISPLLSAYCTGCHGGSAPSGGINLTVYPSVRALALNGRLYGAIAHAPGFSPMPKNAAKLSDCQITQVRKWVGAGAPNN